MHFTTLLLLVAAVGTLRPCRAQVYRSGRDCARPPSVSHFDMSRFLGRWYVIQKSRTDVTCLVYNIALSTEDDFRIELITRFTPAAAIESNRTYMRTSAGRLWMSADRRSSRMSVQFPLNMVGPSTFDVFATDYTRYAGVFSCQPVLFMHRQSATFMSRTPTLSADTLRLLRYSLFDHGIDALQLSDIKQTDCGYEDDDDHKI